MILTAENISKKFNQLTAVNDISLSVEKGCFYSLLGPNGAGKTTTINLLCTLLKSDSGNIFMDGINSSLDPLKIKSLIGVVPQEISLYDDFTAEENLMFWGKMYHVSSASLKTRIEKCLHDFGLTDRKKDKLKTYSGGMKRRINIAVALLHSPKIVFMDEPTVGIDPQSRNNIYEAIQQLKTEGITIFYTTHYMEEAERFSDKVGIIDNGKIIAEGTVAELKTISKIKEDLFIQAISVNENQQKCLKDKFGSAIHFQENKISIETDEVKKEMIPILNFCASLSIEIEQVEIQKANLEKVFLALTGKTLRD